MKMNRMIKYTLIPLLFLGFIGTAVAQAPKIGYVNSVLLLQEIPEVKQANANLEALQKQLQKKGESMLQEFQKKYQDLQMKEQQGELSPKQLEEEARKLREEEVKIQQFEQEMRGQLDEKQKTLLQPILDNVSAKIQEVAKENGFTYIIDDSQGILLYKDESMDVTAMVKAKLGLSN
jgi:outer membrane protein